MDNRQAVEHFHLVFLRHFASVISPGTICLKGGVNLRLYHNSARLSEDIDFDARVVLVDTLKKNVKKVLDSRPLQTELRADGITLSEIKPSKQTETSQRWKFHVLHEGNELPTRLEFSRRNDDAFENCASELPSPGLLAEHKVRGFVFNHYTPPAIYWQKIHALATRREVQARDVFDLHHLSRYAAAARSAPVDEVKLALAQLAMISHEMYLDQVIPFLPTDLASHYETPEQWKAISEQVFNDLSAALPPSVP
ncbi:MAG: nucleotidyl transferase AbiEii/AbiGii toxin family protein [Opitutaceae bacterium]|jgi:predicted nucleotidyltransferase component of viral defense system